MTFIDLEVVGRFVGLIGGITSNLFVTLVEVAFES